MQGSPQVLCRLTGPIAVENAKTRNGTIYGTELWDAVEQSEEFKEMMDNKSFYIGLDHPEEATRSSLCSLLQETAGIVSSWKRQANGVINVIIDVLDTPFGRIVNTLARYGSYIGLSTRAEGDTDHFGNVDPKTFNFLGADFVTVPSQKASRMKLVLEEGFKGSPTQSDIQETIGYLEGFKGNRRLIESLKGKLKEGKVMRRGKALIERKLKEKGFVITEDGFMRNLRTGEDTKILKEGKTRGGYEFTLRGGDYVLVEGCRSKRRRRMEMEDDFEEEFEDEILENEEEEFEDEFGDPINEGMTMGAGKKTQVGPHNSKSRNKMLAKKLEQDLDLEDGEIVTVEPEDGILVEGHQCSVKVRGKVLEVYNRRGRLTERYQLERGDSLVDCIEEIRENYRR